MKREISDELGRQYFFERKCDDRTGIISIGRWKKLLNGTKDCVTNEMIHQTSMLVEHAFEEYLLDLHDYIRIYIFPDF